MCQFSSETSDDAGEKDVDMEEASVEGAEAGENKPISAKTRKKYEKAKMMKKAKKAAKRERLARAHYRIKNSVEERLAMEFLANNIDSLIEHKTNAIERSVVAQTEYYQSASPFFEVKPTTGKGLGLFSLREFETNDLLFHEASLLPVVCGSSVLNYEASFAAASMDRKDRFMALYSRCACDEDPCSESAFLKIFNTNLFEIENHSGNTKSMSGRVYELASRVNHSCWPNAIKFFTEHNNIVLRAIRPIKVGDEITIAYFDVSSFAYNLVLRQLFLRLQARFECCCDACINCLSPEDYEEEKVSPVTSSSESPPPDQVIINDHTSVEIMVSVEIGKWSQCLVATVASIKPCMQEAVDQNEAVARRLEDERKAKNPLEGPPPTEKQIKDETLRVKIQRMLRAMDFICNVYRSLFNSGNPFNLSEEVLDRFMAAYLKEVARTYSGRNIEKDVVGVMSEGFQKFLLG